MSILLNQNRVLSTLFALFFVLNASVLYSQTASKGVGPVKDIALSEEINSAFVERGKMTFKIYCTACHKIGEESIGPNLVGVVQRRKPEWIMSMILNPDEMVEKDSVAKELYLQYKEVKMLKVGLTERQVREILEYFRTLK